ncbi:MAG: histidine kinase, partial [Bacteroidota bacterium]
QKSEMSLNFVEQLSWLLRSTLKRSEEDLVTIEQELEYLMSYIYLQKERFGEKLTVDIEIPISWQTKMVPSFSLQLLVENAIKHNVLAKTQPLLIEIYPDGEQLIIRNQIQRRRDSLQSTGTGLSNLSARFKLLKRGEISISQDEKYFLVKLPMSGNGYYT